MIFFHLQNIPFTLHIKGNLNETRSCEKTHFSSDRLFILPLFFFFSHSEWKTYYKTLLKTLRESSYRTLNKQHRLHTVRIFPKTYCGTCVWIIHELSIDYLDKLFRQHVNRDPPYELRSVCFIALKMALDSKRSNLITMGLNGMHVSCWKKLKNRFHEWLMEFFFRLLFAEVDKGWKVLHRFRTGRRFLMASSTIATLHKWHFVHRK